MSLARFASRMRPTLALTVLAAALHGGAAEAFTFDEVAEQAQIQARQLYRSSSRKAPAQLQALNYDQYRDIRFRPDRALWRADKLPFELMFFHLGKFQKESVRIDEVTPEGTRHVPYRASDFDFGKNKLSPQSWGDLGFGGFRAHYALTGSGYKDELVVFLGASYFRALGAGQRYGLSARGLAIDTVGGEGEEFPAFTRFWAVKPAPDATTLTLFALLDSPRATGAYQFDVHPGGETVMDVHGRIFLRAGVATLGIAPLTSMFFFGENQPHRMDFRPEVHDSDGLMVATGDGEWIWRPLVNPKQTLTTSFSMQRLQGFGLMQRDREFRSYEDGEARYELRPSAWVEPTGTWAPGRSSSCSSTRLTRPTTTSSRTGCRAIRRRPGSRSISRIGCTGRACSRNSTRPARGSSRHVPVVATPSLPKTSSNTSSTSPARRSQHCQPMRQ